MGGVKRSRTAQGVAAERAVLTDLGVLHDPFARRMLTPSMVAVVELVRRGPSRLRTRSVTLAGLAARVSWFDAQVVAAMDDGIDQVAVIGAGYDSRAWRLRRDGVRFFELDHAATQQDKVSRAPEHGPTYVEADLADESAAEALGGRGFDPARPAMLVVEGVTMYLSEAVVGDQLRGLAGAGAPGSRLAIDFYPRRDEGSVQQQRQRRLQRLARLGSDEGFRLALERDEAVALVEEAGWAVDRAVGLRTAAHDLVPAAAGLPVDAVNEHKTLVAAQLTPAS